MRTVGPHGGVDDSERLNPKFPTGRDKVLPALLNDEERWGCLRNQRDTNNNNVAGTLENKADKCTVNHEHGGGPVS